MTSKFDPNHTEESKAKISKTQMKRWQEYFINYPYPTEGKHTCSKCGEVKYFNTEDRYLSEFHIRKNEAHKMEKAGLEGAVYYKPDSQCKKCVNKRLKESRLKALKDDPETYRAKRRQVDKNYRKNIGADEYRKRQRTYARAARRRQGIPQGTERVHDLEKTLYVSAEPLREWIIDTWPTGGHYMAAKNRITNPEKLGKIVQRKVQEVELDWADQVLVTFNGPHLSTLYPDLYSGE